METMVPKLVAEDIPLLNSLLMDVFPGVQYTPGEMTKLRAEISKVCSEMHLVYGENDELGENASCSFHCFVYTGITGLSSYIY